MGETITSYSAESTRMALDIDSRLVEGSWRMAGYTIPAATRPSHRYRISIKLVIWDGSYESGFAYGSSSSFLCMLRFSFVFSLQRIKTLFAIRGRRRCFK